MSFFKIRSDYFKALAKQHKLVAHEVNNRYSYHRMNDSEEFVAAGVSNLGSPCVVHLDCVGKLTGDSNAEPKLKVTHQLLFLSKTDTPMKLDMVESAYDQSYQVMMDFISRMYYELNTEGACGPFKELDLSRFSFTPCGPVGQSFYGWELLMEEEQDGDDFTNYDESKWL